MRKLTQTEFIERSNLKHNNYYDYSKVIYKNVDTKITIICPVHGEFELRPDHHLSGVKCKKCSFEQFHKNNKDNVKKIFIEKSKIKWKNKYNYDNVNYISATQKVTIICPTHGKFQQTPDSHLRHECLKCSTINGSNKQRRSIDEFIKLSNQIHNNFFIYDKSIYVSNKTKLIITCPIHGDFEQLPYNHLMGKGCKLCNIKSKGEEFIIKILDNENIKYKRQYTFDKCINNVTNRKLPFDFYLIDKNILLEFDGIQHFKEIEHWGGKTNLSEIKLRDKIKNIFCNENNIKLYRLTYKDINNRSLQNKLMKIIYPV